MSYQTQHPFVETALPAPFSFSPFSASFVFPWSMCSVHSTALDSQGTNHAHAHSTDTLE